MNELRTKDIFNAKGEVHQILKETLKLINESDRKISLKVIVRKLKAAGVSSQECRISQALRTLVSLGSARFEHNPGNYSRVGKYMNKEGARLPVFIKKKEKTYYCFL